jgi:hypothetical protein
MQVKWNVYYFFLLLMKQFLNNLSENNDKAAIR